MASIAADTALPSAKALASASVMLRWRRSNNLLPMSALTTSAQPVLAIGVGLVALAQYYRMAKFMVLHNKLQRAIQKQT